MELIDLMSTMNEYLLSKSFDDSYYDELARNPKRYTPEEKIILSKYDYEPYLDQQILYCSNIKEINIDFNNLSNRPDISITFVSHKIELSVIYNEVSSYHFGMNHDFGIAPEINRHYIQKQFNPRVSRHFFVFQRADQLLTKMNYIEYKSVSIKSLIEK